MTYQVLSITPVPKPRMTQRDKWNPSKATLRYRAYKDDLNNLFKDEIPARLEVVFGMPMPPSWSEKKKKLKNITPHQQKPDIDNLVKGLLDDLCEDDAYVYEVNARKVWTRSGFIYLQTLTKESTNVRNN